MSKKDNKSPDKNKVEKRTTLDEFEDQKFVDDVPLEDLKIELKEEKEKFKSKDTSQSEQKYKTNDK